MAKKKATTAAPPKPDERAKAGQALIQVVRSLEEEKNIPPELVYTAIERAVRLAMEKHFGEEENIVVQIDRDSGMIHAFKGEKEIDPHSGELGRIAAQAAKQQMIQMFREEESNSLVERWEKRKGELVTGTVTRFEGGAAVVQLADKSEALLPRGEQIPGESYHAGDKVKAVVLEVKKNQHRVKIILSRAHPDFVRRLFEKEIPEIDDGTITIKAVAREAGHRSKVAVSSIDTKVDCVGACVGVRGSRIKNIVEVLGGGERIDIVRWNDMLQILIPAALQPATVDDVSLYPTLQRAIVLVQEDQLSLAIGRRGQNVRLASKLVDWEIEIMTHDELANSVEKAESWFRDIPGMPQEGVDALIEEGFLSYQDLAVLEPHELSSRTGMSEDDADEALIYVEERAEELEKEPKQPKQPREAGAGGAKSRPMTEQAETAPVSEGRKKFESLFSDGPATPTEEQAITEEQVAESAETEPVEASEPPLFMEGDIAEAPVAHLEIAEEPTHTVEARPEEHEGVEAPAEELERPVPGLRELNPEPVDPSAEPQQAHEESPHHHEEPGHPGEPAGSGEPGA
jgi:transcription termination/antitermination protein NusA